jgi:hypothetical protein
MTCGPIYLASNLLVFSLRGLHKSTKRPTSKSGNLTFGSLHALVSSWYFCKFATTMSLCNSNRSFSSTSLGQAGASVMARKLRCFISSGSTALAPYISRKGMKFLALHNVVLWLHTFYGMTSAHFPFVSPSSIFLIASNIKALALSTAPLVWR